MASAGTETSASSSSTTLWATASKEWVIAPKPKPGRKPKKDVSVPAAEVDAKGRRVQNRAAQRAFRERKQSQLAELQARIQSYEQGEIERNVALQSIAKRLKDENEVLRQENFALKAKITELEEAHVNKSHEPSNHINALHLADKKRGRDSSPSSGTSAKKRTRRDTTTEPRRHSSLSADSATHLPSPSSMVSTPDPADAIDRFSPFPYESQPAPDSSGFNSLDVFPSIAKPDDPLRPFAFDCGFCDQTTICVCREIAAQTIVEQAVISNNFRSTVFDSEPVVSARKKAADRSASDEARESSSILDNLPEYQPPVPLRKRNNGVSVNSIFPVHASLPSDNKEQAICSGDPSNCLACADDSFGKAFCAAIGNSATTCDCSAETISRCCGGASSCTGCPSTSTSSSGPAASNEHAALMPTNDAWQKIKEHPNVQFADLSLLAEVVASRSKCSGPQLTISPAPQLHHHEEDSTATRAGDGRDSSSNRRTDNSPPPQLVPQEVLLECGRRRMRQVHPAGVREALRLLDAKFS